MRQLIGALLANQGRCRSWVGKRPTRTGSHVVVFTHNSGYGTQCKFSNGLLTNDKVPCVTSWYVPLVGGIYCRHTIKPGNVQMCLPRVLQVTN